MDFSAPLPSDPCELAVGDAMRLMRLGELSPVELVESSLARIAATQPTIRAWNTILADEARADARVAEDELRAGVDRGPLHGIPTGIKDIIDVAGVRTTCNSRVREAAAPAAEDAPVVASLRRAGMIVLGKTVTQEFAAGVVSAPCRNPWDPARIPGGSSGGTAAALAAGTFPVAMGSDTGGSIRIPAAACGVVGLKPTYGAVSKRGVYPLAWSLDTVGPLARTVEDAALVYNAIAGHDPLDPMSARFQPEDATAEIGRDLAGLRIGVVRGAFFERIQPAVAAAFDAALPVFSDLGATVLEVEWAESADARAAGMIINRVETVGVHSDGLREHPEHYGPELRLRLEANRLFPAGGYLRALQARVLMRESIARLFAEHRLDAIVVPTLPGVAAPADDTFVDYPDGSREPVALAYTRLCTVFNCTGQPALSVPSGFSAAGLPVALTIAGRPFAEARVCRIGHAYERAAGWWTRRPPLLEA